MFKKVRIQNVSYLAPSWSDMGEMAVALAKKLKNKKLKFDRIIALAKGGLPWARQLQDLLDIPKLSSVEIRSYTGIGKASQKPVVTQKLPVAIKGEHILIYDDVVDTGETVACAKKYLLGEKKASSVVVASHFFKKHSKIKVDIFAKQTDAWIIFPHDSGEMIRLLKKEWKHMDSKQMKSNLLRIGTERSIIDFILT